MKTTTIFDILFSNKKSESYEQALSSLDRVRDIVTNVTMEYPDVKSKEIQTVKNKWVELGQPIGQGVHSMGLHTGDDYLSLLVHYQENGYLAPHFHSTEWELIKILDGSCYDKSTDTELVKGDVYVIPRGVVHHIISTGSECYMYIMFTDNKNRLKISEKEKAIAQQLIGKKHSFIAE